MATVSITPASGSITATKTVCKIDVASLDSNDDSAFDAAKSPSEPQISYYLAFIDEDDAEQGRSYVFTPSQDGKHQFNNYIFPAAGTWTVDLNLTEDDSTVATTSVVVA